MTTESEKSPGKSASVNHLVMGRYCEIVLLMTGPMVGVAGGDTHAFRFVAGYEQLRPGTTCLVAPPSVEKFLPAAVTGRLLALRTPFQSKIRNIFAYTLIVAMRSVLATLRMPPAGVVVASSHFVNDAIPCAIARMRGRGRIAVFIYHIVADMDRKRSVRTVVSEVLERISLALFRRYAEVVFVDNDEVVESLQKRGFKMDRIVMTANAFDPLVPLPPRIDSNPPVLSYLGRFVEEKGIWDMLEIGKRLARTSPDASIEMVGDGPLHERFASELKASGLSNIKLRGFVSETDKWELLRRSNVFVAPSREEGWGIAVGEALTAGTPVVAYDLPAYRYLGDAIQRVPPGETSKFVEQVCNLVGDPLKLAAATSALESTAAGLPRWSEILENEFSVLQDRLLSTADAKR